MYRISYICVLYVDLSFGSFPTCEQWQINKMKAYGCKPI